MKAFIKKYKKYVRLWWIQEPTEPVVKPVEDRLAQLNELDMSLKMAFDRANETEIRYLVKCGANLIVGGHCLLYELIKGRRPAMVELAFELGADAHHDDEQPLKSILSTDMSYYMGFENIVSMVKSAIAHGADPEVGIKFLLSPSIVVRYRDEQRKILMDILVPAFDNKKLSEYAERALGEEGKTDVHYERPRL